MSESNNSDARIIVLATSVAKRNYLQQFTHWLQMVWMSCQDAIFILTRSSEIVICLIPLLLLTPASMLAVSLCDVSDNTTHSRISDWTWRYTRSAITSLGPAFVKLFQWVATRRDIFPPHVCDRLSVLHDKGIPHAWLHTEQALIACFGPDYKSRGLVIDCDDDDDKVEGSKHNAALIGCGSAAQVYRGTLVSADGEWNEPSRRVAIKVLHPRLLERVTRDLTFVQAVADLVHSLPIERIRMLNLSRAVRTFGDILMRQTDLQIEAENLIQFRFNFYHNEREERNSSIRFPKPIEGWIGQTVLVEDLVDDAKPISEYLNDSTEQGLQNRRDLASPLLRAFLKMVFLDNFVHCDLHAGNVLIQSSAISDEPKNTWKQLLSKWNVRFATVPENRSSKLQIVFLDAGIAMSLSPNDQRNLLDLFRAVILNDGNQAGRLMVERARYERCTETPGGVDAFARGIEDLVDEFHVSRQKGLTLGAVRIGSLLSRVLDLCREYGVEIDPSMSSIVVSTLVLEGLGRSLEPDLNLIDFAIPFVLGRGRV